MSTLNKIYVLVFSFITICCQSPNISNEKGILLHVDVHNAQQFVSSDESGLIDNSECNIFQITCSTGIGTIEDMKFDNDKIILLDNGRQRLHILDKDGKCEREIYHLGKSSNEYIEITDFFPINERVYILDMSSMKVVEYDYDGSCEGVTDISNYWANELFVLKDNLFLVNEGSDTKFGQQHVFEIKKDGTLVKSYIPFEDRPGLVCDVCYSLRSTDSIMYAQRETNTIYMITPQKCEPILSIDFGDYNLPDKLKMMDARELMSSTNNEYKRYSLGVEKIQTSDNLLFVRFQARDNNYLLVINTINYETVLFCRGIAINNMYHLGLMNYYIHKNFIYDVYDSDDFVDIVENMKEEGFLIEKGYLKQLEDIASNNIFAEGNPIVIKYKIKE